VCPLQNGRQAHIFEGLEHYPTHDWSPTIGTALKTGYRWLEDVLRRLQAGEAIDLAGVDVHPQACLTRAAASAVGYRPLPRLVGLSRFPAVAAAAWK
jgi:hypothetical protein